MIQAVVFDIGETLIDDTREWAAWADWLGVPPNTVSALVGAVTVLGRDNADALRLIRPGIDPTAERDAREAAGKGEQIDEGDLYSDVRAALAELRARGIWVGVAGNQTARAAELLRALDLPADAIATSGEWGVAKPSPEFFRKLVDWVGRPADRILYVGDHRDNDILAPATVGLKAALIRRGPWGHLWADDPLVVNVATWRLDTLAQLPDLLTNS